MLKYLGKSIFTFALSLVLIISGLLTAYAETLPLSIIIDGKDVSNQVNAISVNGYAYAKYDSIFNAMGATSVLDMENSSIAVEKSYSDGDKITFSIIFDMEYLDSETGSLPGKIENTSYKKSPRSSDISEQTMVPNLYFSDGYIYVPITFMSQYLFYSNQYVADINTSIYTTLPYSSKNNIPDNPIVLTKDNLINVLIEDDNIELSAENLLKQFMKNPDSLQIYSCNLITGTAPEGMLYKMAIDIDDWQYSMDLISNNNLVEVKLLFVDYSAMNGLGGYNRNICAIDLNNNCIYWGSNDNLVKHYYYKYVLGYNVN